MAKLVRWLSISESLWSNCEFGNPNGVQCNRKFGNPVRELQELDESKSLGCQIGQRFLGLHVLVDMTQIILHILATSLNRREEQHEGLEPRSSGVWGLGHKDCGLRVAFCPAFAAFGSWITFFGGVDSWKTRFFGSQLSENRPFPKVGSWEAGFSGSRLSENRFFLESVFKKTNSIS